MISFSLLIFFVRWYVWWGISEVNLFHCILQIYASSSWSSQRFTITATTYYLFTLIRHKFLCSGSQSYMINYWQTGIDHLYSKALWRPFQMMVSYPVVQLPEGGIQADYTGGVIGIWLPMKRLTDIWYAMSSSRLSMWSCIFGKKLPTENPNIRRSQHSPFPGCSTNVP